MPRTFNGTTDKVKVTVGALTGMTYGAVAAVVKLNVGTVGDGYYTLFATDTTVQSVLQIALTDTGHYFYGVDSGGSEDVGGPSSSDGWVLVVLQKATGSATPTYWKYIFNTGVLTASTAGTSVANSVRSVSQAWVGAEKGTENFYGDIAAVAAWNNSAPFTDDLVYSLASDWSQWVKQAPTSLWVMDQAATSQPINDWIGTSPELTLSATTVGASSAPVGYGHQILTPMAMDAAGGSLDVPTLHLPPQFNVYRM